MDNDGKKLVPNVQYGCQQGNMQYGVLWGEDQCWYEVVQFLPPACWRKEKSLSFVYKEQEVVGFLR
jgi:hypothetical protein